MSALLFLIVFFNFYLQKILTEVTVDEPCIILPDEVSMDDLKLLIDFVYRGEIKFLISQISSLSKLAQMLGIPGLPGFTEVVSKYYQTQI
jgi:BTB/POZ domain